MSRSYISSPPNAFVASSGTSLTLASLIIEMCGNSLSILDCTQHNILKGNFTPKEQCCPAHQWKSFGLHTAVIYTYTFEVSFRGYPD
jgi:hypothetical protein